MLRPGSTARQRAISGIDSDLGPGCQAQREAQPLSRLGCEQQRLQLHPARGHG